MGAERVAMTVESRAARKEPSQAPDMTRRSCWVEGSGGRGSEGLEGSSSSSCELRTGSGVEVGCSSSGGWVGLPCLLVRRGDCSVGSWEGGEVETGMMMKKYIGRMALLSRAPIDEITVGFLELTCVCLLSGIYAYT